jgi:hypothetical protein
MIRRKIARSIPESTGGRANGASIPFASALRRAAQARLLDDYFVRKEERGGAVVKLHQVHAPVQIIYLTENPWLFAESTAPFVVAHRSLQLAMLSDQSFCAYTVQHISTPPLLPGNPGVPILPYILASFGPDI